MRRSDLFSSSFVRHIDRFSFLRSSSSSSFYLIRFPYCCLHSGCLINNHSRRTGFSWTLIACGTARPGSRLEKDFCLKGRSGAVGRKWNKDRGSRERGRSGVVVSFYEIAVSCPSQLIRLVRVWQQESRGRWGKTAGGTNKGRTLMNSADNKQQRVVLGWRK